MNNDANQTKGDILEPEVVFEKIPSSRKNLITVMVLSVALAHQVLGKEAPKKGKLNPGQGKKIVTAIEKAVRETFPEVAPMILGMFGIEMLNLMPMIKDPDKVIKEMVAEYAGLIAENNACPSPIPDLG
jgi:hypothetical protein